MEKQFDDWNRVKKRLSQKKRIFIQERDIVWCCIGHNIGDEENGKSHVFSRPVLILKKISTHTFIGIPLTTAIKEGSWYVPISIHGKMSSTLLHQLRLFDVKRITNKIARLDEKDFKEVCMKLKVLLAL